MNDRTEYPRYADLQAENTALRDLIAAVITALDVPANADLTDHGTEVHLRALRDRAGSARIALRGLDTASVNPAARAAWLREKTAESPITYEPYQHTPLPELAPDAVQAEEQPAPEPAQADGPTTPTATGLVARAEQVRDQLTAARLPQAAVWEVTHPSDDMLAAYADRPENLVMLSGRVESAADVTAWATVWRVPVNADPSPTYPTARTVIDGVTVEVWACTNGGAR